MKKEKGIKHMRVATYNVLVADFGKSIDKIAAEIKDNNIDIIGLQELDLNVNRSGNIDVLRLLSEKSGLEHFHFFPAVVRKEGGYCGIGTLSKYPILNANLRKFEYRNFEQRILGSVEIEVNGKIINFFNTHLSYEDNDVRIEQIKMMQNIISKKMPYVLVGDFNLGSFSELKEIKNANIVNNEKTSFTTFKGDTSNKNGFYSIDNIIVSNDFKVTFADVFPSESSDHEMLVADIEL